MTLFTGKFPKYVALDGADFSLVRMVNACPFCIKHGAMNKVSKEGYWRCLDKNCRAGCKRVEDGKE